MDNLTRNDILKMQEHVLTTNTLLEPYDGIDINENDIKIYAQHIRQKLVNYAQRNPTSKCWAYPAFHTNCPISLPNVSPLPYFKKLRRMTIVYLKSKLTDIDIKQTDKYSIYFQW